MELENIDVVIIGAGPSGCVAASYLVNNGLNVLVVEKSKFPRFVIGESLLPRCMDHFDEVGLLDALKEQSFEVKAGARFLRGDEECNFDFSKKFGEGWDWTWQVPRADFDQTLVEATQKKGVQMMFESEVVDVQCEKMQSSVKFKDLQGVEHEVHCKFVIDSSGYGRVLPRLFDLDLPSELPKNSSAFVHVQDTRRPEGKEGTMITFDILETKVWIWVIPFSNGVTSIGVVGPTEIINQDSIDPETIIRSFFEQSEHYRDRFKDLPFLFEGRKIQNFSTNVKQLHGDGYALTGNSAEFLDPVFSSGVTFATESGLLAAKLAKRQIDGEEIDWDKEFTDYIKGGVSVFSTYVKEWYTGNLQTLFFHQPENPEVKKQICAVLAGYVWNKENPFVKKHQRIVANLAYLIDNE